MTNTLSKFQIAAIKRTAQNVKNLNRRLTTLKKKIEETTAEINLIEDSINTWEEPVRKMTGGKTSTQILAELEIEESDPSANITPAETPAEELEGYPAE
jgi:phage shock protein A